MTESKLNIKSIVLGGGCFWCTEAVFNMLKGIIKVTPGYAGGTTSNPTYDSVSMGKTGHAEVISVEYDSGILSLTEILTVFFGSHDPTSLNRQGADTGTQYRSVIYFTEAGDEPVITEFIKNINASSKFGKDIVTEVRPLDVFYPAEDYHKNYFENNKTNPYCELVINPKLEKVVKDFAELINRN